MYSAAIKLSRRISTTNNKTVKKCIKHPSIRSVLGTTSSNNNTSLFSSSSSKDKNTEELFTEGEWKGCTKRYIKPLRIKSRGADILTNPLYNKGTAHKSCERDRLRIRGLLPPRVQNAQRQIERFLMAFHSEENDIKKHLMLEDLHDRNETLYHRIIIDHVEEMAPLIYTPTVGQACSEFGARYRRPRGMYFTEADRNNMTAMVYNWPHDDVHVIVVTDGSRILGLGDLGAHGMGIPIGKLSLYCAAGGVAPHRVLPVVLDVGTNNEELLNDPFYLGVPKRRLTGDKYYELVDEFMQAVKYRWPNVLVQFEDFSSDKAQTLLNKYRNDHLCFNDDIQGTGATTLAGILGALRAKGEDVSSLSKQRILIAGAGSAGVGVAQSLYQAMIVQGASEHDAKNAFFIADQDGLLGIERGADGLTNEQIMFARDDDNNLPLHDIVEKYKPTILLGMTTVSSLFDEKLVKEMAKNCERPIIFPLSNPTIKSECTALQAYEWTNGKCIFASGSPFDSVTLDNNGNDTTFHPSQCNNMYIFPGVGFGASVCGAKTITDAMLYKAAEALANSLTPEDLAKGRVFPPITKIRDVSHCVAVSVVKEALDDDQATKVTEGDSKDIEGFVWGKMYDPLYSPLIERREISI